MSKWNIRWSHLVFVALLFVATSCGGKQKPTPTPTPEPTPPTPPPVSIQGQLRLNNVQLVSSQEVIELPSLVAHEKIK